MAEPSPGTRSNADDEPSPLAEMLEAPPSVIARGAVYLIAVVVVAAVSWGALGTIDEVVTAPATVTTPANVARVTAPIRGMVEELLVDAGERVAPGRRVAALRSPEAARLRAEVRRLEAAAARARSDGAASFTMKLGHLRQEIAEREAVLSAFKVAAAAKVARMRASGPAPAGEIDLAESEARLEAARLEAGVAEAKRREAALGEEAARTLRTAELELDEARRTLAAIAAAGAEFDLQDEARVFVVARSEGLAAPAAARAEGAAVERGQELLQLVPPGAALGAHIALAQSDLMKVRPGQPLRLRVQSFPHQQFGALTGTVREVSRVPVRGDQGSTAFLVVATLDLGHFSRGGERVSVPAGAAGIAEIVVGRGSLLGRTLATFRDLAGN